MEHASLLFKVVVYMVRSLSYIKKVYNRLRYGDIEKVLKNCDKIIEKESEIKDIVDSGTMEDLDWIITKIKLIGKLEMLNKELDDLTTEFCASTTGVRGEAKICSKNIRGKFEEMYEHRKSVLRNYENLADVLREQIKNRSVDKKIHLKIIESKIRPIEIKMEECYDKAKRDIRILKELRGS